jgi:hypothetical protein
VHTAATSGVEDVEASDVAQVQGHEPPLELAAFVVYGWREVGPLFAPALMLDCHSYPGRRCPNNQLGIDALNSQADRIKTDFGRA